MRFIRVLVLSLFIPATIWAKGNVSDSVRIFYELDSIINASGENDVTTTIRLMKRQRAIADELQIDSLFISCHSNKGSLMGMSGMLEDALKEYYSALRIAERLHKPAQEASLLMRLGLTYQGISDYAKSTECYRASKQKSIAMGSVDTIDINYELGYNMVAQGEVEKGIAMIKDNLRAAEQRGNEDRIVTGLDNLSSLYDNLGLNDSVQVYLEQILRYPKGFRSNYRKMVIYAHFSEMYVKLKQWDKAAEYQKRTMALATVVHAIDWKMNCYRLQAIIDKAKGRYKEAIEAQEAALEIKDSVNQKNYSNNMAVMTAVYDLEKKQAQIELLNKDKLLTEVTIKQERNQKRMILLGALLALGMIITTALAWLQRRTRRLQEVFSARLLEDQENERQRISRELHDSIGQNILFIKNQLAVLPAGIPAPVTYAVSATIEDVRNISKDLYPNQLEKYGLAAAIEALAAKVTDGNSIFVSADMGDTDKVLSKTMKINLYRIVQEALNNIMKHAGATAVRITGNIAHDRMIMEVMDNGRGFDTSLLARKAQSSFGVLNMEERARMLGGKFNISSDAKGTKITVTIPVNNEV